MAEDDRHRPIKATSRICMAPGLDLVLPRDLALMGRLEEAVLHPEGVGVRVRVQGQCAVLRDLQEAVIRLRGPVVATPLPVEADLALPLGHPPWIPIVSAAKLLRKAGRQVQLDG